MSLFCFSSCGYEREMVSGVGCVELFLLVCECLKKKLCLLIVRIRMTYLLMIVVHRSLCWLMSVFILFLLLVDMAGNWLVMLAV